MHYSRTFTFDRSVGVALSAALKIGAGADDSQLDPELYVPNAPDGVFGVAYPQACWRLEPFVTDPEWLALRPLPSQGSAVLADIEEMKRRIAAHDGKVAELRKSGDRKALAALAHCAETSAEAAAIDRGVSPKLATSLKARPAGEAFPRPAGRPELLDSVTYSELMAAEMTRKDIVPESFNGAGSAIAAASRSPGPRGIESSEHAAGSTERVKRRREEIHRGLHMAATGAGAVADDDGDYQERLERVRRKLSGSKVLDCFARIREAQLARYVQFLGLLSRFPLKTEDYSDYTWLPKDPADRKRVLWTYALEHLYRREMEQSFAVRYRDECLGELTKLLYFENPELPESHKGQLLWREVRGNDNYVALTPPVDPELTCWANSMAHEALRLESLGEHQNHAEAIT